MSGRDGVFNGRLAAAALAALALCLLCPPADALGKGPPRQDTGGISGSVVDGSGAPVPEARVSVFRHADFVRRGVGTRASRALTTKDGLFQLSNLVTGRHVLVASKPGYKSATSRVEVISAKTITVQMTLEPAKQRRPAQGHKRAHARAKGS